jgi:hypothetical protein
VNDARADRRAELKREIAKLDRAIYAVACPFCAAQPGQKCVNAHAAPVSQFHMGRVHSGHLLLKYGAR